MCDYRARATRLLVDGGYHVDDHAVALHPSEPSMFLHCSSVVAIQANWESEVRANIRTFLPGVWALGVYIVSGISVMTCSQWPHPCCSLHKRGSPVTACSD